MNRTVPLTLTLGLALSACSDLDSSDQAVAVDTPSVASPQKAPPQLLLKEVANDSDVLAQYRLGLCYEYFSAMPCHASSPRESILDSNSCGKLSESNNYSVDVRELECPRKTISRDAEMAASWYRKAAEHDDVNAQFRLARMYDTGKGVAPDYRKAADWYRKAAEQGLSEAENSLGDLYAKGQGVPQDFAEALKWFKKAAEDNNAYAFNNLGFMYFNGLGVPKDDFAAAQWYAKNQGSVVAVNSMNGHPLGFICRYGREAHPGYAGAGESVPPSDDSILQYLSCPNHIGLIDRMGKVVLPPIFDGVGSFAKNGLAPVAVDGRWGFVDREDRMVITPQYDQVSEFNEQGIAAAMNPDGTFDFIRSNGRPVTRQHFEQFVGDGHEHLQFLRRRHPERTCCNNIVGIPQALPPVQFASGLLPVRKAGLWGYISPTGKWVIPPRYDDAQPFAYNSFASVRMGTEWSYINVRGQIISNEMWLSDKSTPDETKLANRPSRPYNGQNGGLAIASHFYETGDFANGLAKVRKYVNQKWAYINVKGETVIPPTFDCASNFADEGLAYGQVGGEAGFFDETGTIRIRSAYPIIMGFSPTGYAYIRAESGCPETPMVVNFIE